MEVEDIVMTVLGIHDDDDDDDDGEQEFEAGDEGCAFLDILIPPYDPSDNRDCHYYIAKQSPDKEDMYELLQTDPPAPDKWDVTSARYGGPAPPQQPTPAADHS